ncbi:hypothetical protein [Paracnuella aquatica]|uniref:hypothetical protein n=1 Tax=Paracnuella aquatica TaxID=2268757 RepID=UPI000DF000B7|nr:hypothetical protein [Paracnuella aquatica]RPD44392.1 hypothetical protein DRJ53_16880 [Paracnuella aquatica]
MNEKNFNYLKDSLKYLGFGEAIGGQLAEKMKEGAKEFMLDHSAAFSDKQLDASLFFRRSESSDLYFLNKWIGTVGQYEAARSQSFYINKGHGVTLKEGFNLLEGRAVHKELTDKEGQSYKAWLQLDGKEKDAVGNYKVNQYHEKYGFDLEQKLGALPIKGIDDPEQKAALIRSLQKGNLQSVTLEKNGQSDALLISANPKYKSIAVMDQSGKFIPQQSLEKRYGLVQKEPEVKLMGKVAPTGEKSQSKSSERLAKNNKDQSRPKENSQALPKMRVGRGSKGMKP